MQLTFTCYNDGHRDISPKCSNGDMDGTLVQFLFFYYLQCPLDGGVYQYNCLAKSQKKGTAAPQRTRGQQRSAS